MSAIQLKELNLASLKSRMAGNLSAKEALKNVVPFQWDEKIESGEKKVVVEEKKRG